MNKRIFVASTLDNNIELLEAIEDKATKYSCELSYYKYEDAQDRFDKMQQDIIDCDFSIFVDLNTAVPIFNNSQSLPFIQLVEFLRTRQFKNERGDIDEKPAIFCRYLSHGYDDDFDDDLDDIDDGSEFIEEINSPEINGAQKIINTFVENQTFNINHLRFFIERAFPLCGIPIRRNKTLISCPFEIIRNQKNNYDDIVDAIDSDGACEIVKVSGIRADNGRQHTEMACRNADTYLGILTRSYGEYDDFWEKTYVQYEYDFAKTHNYPVYVLIPDGGFTFHGAKKTHPKDDFRKYRKALKNESKEEKWNIRCSQLRTYILPLCDAIPTYHFPGRMVPLFKLYVGVPMFSSA